jgi:hypothetical protein
MMEEVKQITIVIDEIDIEELNEDQLTELLVEKFKEAGYIPTDRPVVVRVGKMSSIRAVENDTQEEVEIYTFAQILNKNGSKKSVITGRVV